jgi:hypothetical protein
MRSHIQFPCSDLSIVARACSQGVSPIADLSAKGYSHNRHRVQRHLHPARKEVACPAQEAWVDASLYGGARGNGPEFHFRPRERREGNLHTEFGTPREGF